MMADNDEQENVLDLQHLRELRRRWLSRIKYSSCSCGNVQAVLVVDAVTEGKPVLDIQGQYQYHCPSCGALFSVTKERDSDQ